MPSMGRPANLESIGNRNNIQIHRGRPSGAQSNKKESTQDVLDRATGNVKKSMFVDRNSHNKMGKDEFLKLLSFQLQNQDPMNPMEQNKFAADLAQFAQLEQLANMNGQMKNLNVNAPAQEKFYAASFLGKEITTVGTSINLESEGGRAELPFNLEKDAAKVIIRVLDENGNTISQIEKENLRAGNNSVWWNGTNLAGTTQPKGIYAMAVQAFDDKYERVSAQTRVKGTVTGVTFESGSPVLSVAGKKVFLRDVVSFRLPGEGQIAKRNLPNPQEIYKQMMKNPNLNKLPNLNNVMGKENGK